MAEIYLKAPIVEALCEFQFEPGQPWDMTIPGRFYEKIRENFPMREEKTNIEIGISPKGAGVEQEVKGTKVMQFFREDKTALVQVGPNLLAINQLSPYPTWKEFRSLILGKLDIYKNITEPKGFKRIGLRYINRINFEGNSVELKDYFNVYPNFPDKLPETYAPLTIRAEFPHEEERDRLILTLASAIPEKPDTVSIVLDLDYVMRSPGKVPLGETKKWLESAHDAVKATFEACITEKCRALFRGR